MCDPIFGTGRGVVIDSGVFVAKGIMLFEERGVYTGAIIKKRKYCTKGVPSDDIDRNFHNRDVGDADMLEAKKKRRPTNWLPLNQMPHDI